MSPSQLVHAHTRTGGVLQYSKDALWRGLQPGDGNGQ